MDWIGLFKFLGSAGIISALVAYIVKCVIDTILASRIESYKSNLEKIAIEHEIRFQQLHTERAQVIKELYEKIVVLDFALKTTLNAFQHTSEPSLEEKVQAVSKAHNDLYFFYMPKRIYFEKKTCLILDKIIKSSQGVFIKITNLPVSYESPEYKYDRSLLKKKHEYWDRARSIMENELVQLKEELEDNFRELLGLKASSKNKEE